MVNDNDEPIRIFSENDMKNLDQFSLLGNLKAKKLVVAKDWISNKDAYNLMDENWISALPIVNEGNKLIWILTKKDCIRHEIYKPTLDSDGKLNVAVAVGIHGFDKIRILYDMWINIFVLDTAHWYQKRMLESIKKFREEFGISSAYYATFQPDGWAYDLRRMRLCAWLILTKHVGGVVLIGNCWIII